MDEAQVQQIVDELLSSLEPLETQSSALLQFLKVKGLATDAELAPFLEQAGNTANVRWRAVKVRIAALISSAMKPLEQSGGSSATKSSQPSYEPLVETKPQKQEENAQKEEKPQKEEKQIEKNGRKNMSDNEKQKPEVAPAQRADDTTKSGPSIPESDEAPKDNRSTNSDAREAPDKNDAREAA
jgi:hypothetical protein